VGFDAASVAALLTTLTTRALAGQLTLTTSSTTLRYVESRCMGVESVKPRGQPPFTLVSVRAVYRAPNVATPIPTTNPLLPGWVQGYDVAGGIQRSFGPILTDLLRFSIVCDSEPAMILVAKGLLLQHLQTQFDLLDGANKAGRAPVLVP
jgi:hypothetical protein